MMHNMSITIRAMLFVSIAITISMVSLLFLVETSIKDHFIDLDNETMENKTLVIKQFANRIDAVQRIINWDTTNPDSKFYIEILEGNRVLYKSERDAFILKKYNDTLIHVSENDNAAPHKYISKKIDFKKSDKLYSVAIYLDSSVHAHFLSDFRVQLLVIVFAVWAAIILSTYLGIRQGHKPIYILSKHMSSIQAERLSSTLEPGQYPRELRELVGSFNTMLSKLQNSFVKLSDFSDDVAHELRTPLTNIIMQAQVGLNQERSIPEYKEFLYSILEELEHLAKMVSDMLWIARSDKGLIYANKELLDIENELSSILDFFVYLAEEKNLTFKVVNTQKLVYADKIMLRRSISNLISNAIKYSKSNSIISISVYSNKENDSIIEINNKCKDIISYDDSLRMFDRFYRADESRSSNNDSVGLGLSIVKSITEINGGKTWNKLSGDHISFYLLFPTK
ncbi:heavy metal sensor histidine kinase [Aeromonas veronii]|nr:heavy metal sensor histidine kinase [Aeromonas veronii]